MAGHEGTEAVAPAGQRHYQPALEACRTEPGRLQNHFYRELSAHGRTAPAYRIPPHPPDARQGRTAGYSAGRADCWRHDNGRCVVLLWSAELPLSCATSGRVE